MKLGFDAKRAFYNHSGLGVYSRSLITSISKIISNNDIILFTPKKKIWSSDIRTVTSRLGFLWRSAGIYFDVLRYKIDIYHGLAGELPFFLPKSVKTVVTIHDLLFLKFPEDYPWIDRFIYNLKARYACKRADVIIAVSEVTMSDIISHYGVKPDKIKVIPVAAPSLPPTLIKRPHEKDYILCISSFLGRKNQVLLLNAYLKIANEVDYDLIFIGSGPERKKAIELAERSPYNHRIYFISGISDSDKFNYLHHCLFSVYPSKGEGFGIPILESFLCKKAIVLSDTPIHREVAGNAGVYFTANSTNELAKKLLELSASKKNLNIENANKQLENFDGRKLYPQITEVYFSLMGRTPIT